MAGYFRALSLLAGSDKLYFRDGRDFKVLNDEHVEGTDGFRLVYKQGINCPSQQFQNEPATQLYINCLV